MAELPSCKVKEKRGYKDLKVWEKSHILAVNIYKLTSKFPKEEIFGLTSQIRRASFSVPLNIVEGQASRSKEEFLNFLNISNRSLSEVEYLLEVVKELDLISENEYNCLEDSRKEIAYMLTALIKSINAKL